MLRGITSVLRHSVDRALPLAVALAAGLTFAGPAAAVDLLELPAVQSGAATQALLLDVTARGADGFVAVGEYGVIVVSGDGGRSWTQASVPVSVSLTAVHFPSPEQGWAVGHDGLILHSGDGGATWQKQLDGHRLNEQVVGVAEAIVANFRAELEALEAEEDPDESALEDAAFLLEEAEFMLEGAADDVAAGPVRPLLDVWFRDERDGYVSGAYGMLLHTADGGANWALVSDRMRNVQGFHLNQIAPAPDGTLFIAGEAGFVFRSADGGAHWETLEPGYEGSFYGLVISPAANGDYELLAYGLRGNLFRSTDRGETWEPLVSGTQVTLTTGVDLADGTVLLGGQGGTILVRAPGQPTFAPGMNPDRRVISGMASRGDGTVLIVGLGGIRLADAAGRPVESAPGTH
jgi:photosystem II stability/assembly factor-like uncharacterized protein